MDVSGYIPKAADGENSLVWPAVFCSSRPSRGEASTEGGGRSIWANNLSKEAAIPFISHPDADPLIPVLQLRFRRVQYLLQILESWEGERLMIVPFLVCPGE
jgi:hypothetical protein